MLSTLCLRAVSIADLCKALLKTLAALLPASAQDSLKRFRFRRQIHNGTFVPDEAEMAFIRQTVRPGDWAIDVGANVGHYTAHLSNCVGATGRVIAFEPIPETFALLATNTTAFPAQNVTALSAAASDRVGVAAMSLPTFTTGLRNYYRAALSPTGEFAVLCLPIDSLGLPRVSLIKVDAEGHDLVVLKGARALIERDRPALIVECDLHGDVAAWLRDLGYRLSMAPGSPNVIATYGERAS